MPRHEALKALDIYKRAGQQANRLSDFYEVCKGLELARNFQFPVLREPPQSFLITMEEYIREAPRVVTVPTELLLLLTYRPDEGLAEDTQLSKNEPEPYASANVVVVSTVETPPPPPSPTQTSIDTGDLLASFLLGVIPVFIAWLYSEFLEYKKSAAHSKVHSDNNLVELEDATIKEDDRVVLLEGGLGFLLWKSLF